MLLRTAYNAAVVRGRNIRFFSFSRNRSFAIEPPQEYPSENQNRQKQKPDITKTTVFMVFFRVTLYVSPQIRTMKSAYEIAMERLNKTAPTTKLTAKQKKELAELDSRYAAKIAEREIALNSEIAKTAEDFEKEESLRDQLVNERKKLQAELEEKKERVRGAAVARSTEK